MDKVYIDRDLLLEAAKGTDAYMQIKSIVSGLPESGYRKQSEGEWVTSVADFHGEVLSDECSVCGWTRLKNNTVTKRYYFCLNCGAKMKGGDGK